MIRMPPFPIRKYHHSRPLLAQYADDFKPIVPCVLHPPVWDIERPAPRRTQYPAGVSSLTSAILGAATRSHLALGQIEDAGAVSALCHLKERTAAGLLYIVAVSGQSKNIEWEARHVSRKRIQIGRKRIANGASESPRYFYSISRYVGARRLQYILA